MKKDMFTLALALGLVFLPILSWGETIGGDALRQMWEGKTVKMMLASGSETELTFEAGGIAKLNGAMKDEGQWRVTDKGYCARWKIIRNGAERCVTVEKEGDNIFLRNTDGGLVATVLGIKE